MKHIRTAQTAVWLNSCCDSTVLDLSDKSSPSRVVFCDEMPRVRYTHTHFGTSGNVRQAYMCEKQQFCSNEKLRMYFTVEQLSASRYRTVSVITMLWVGRSGVRIPAGLNISTPKCALRFLDHPVSTVGLIPSRLEQRFRISEASWSA